MCGEAPKRLAPGRPPAGGSWVVRTILVMPDRDVRVRRARDQVSRLVSWRLSPALLLLALASLGVACSASGGVASDALDGPLTHDAAEERAADARNTRPPDGAPLADRATANHQTTNEPRPTVDSEPPDSGPPDSGRASPHRRQRTTRQRTTRQRTTRQRTTSDDDLLQETPELVGSPPSLLADLAFG